jgi:transposase
VPPTPIQELRDLTRIPKQLAREVAQHTPRIQKTLEDANIKITGVMTDLLGVSFLLQGVRALVGQTIVAVAASAGTGERSYGIIWRGREVFA